MSLVTCSASCVFVLLNAGHKTVHHGQVDGLEIVVHPGRIAFGGAGDLLPLAVDLQTFFDEQNGIGVVLIPSGIDGHGTVEGLVGLQAGGLGMGQQDMAANSKANSSILREIFIETAYLS